MKTARHSLSFLHRSHVAGIRTCVRDPTGVSPDGGNTMKERRWQDWLNLLIGVWLFISPWAVGFASSGW
jgi:hypothetical protein